MKIIVLAGGISPERYVSLASGTMIANNLIEMNHEVLLLDLYLGIDDISDINKLYKTKKDELYKYELTNEVPDLEKLMKDNNSTAFIGKNVIELCKQADIVFMALHGAIGENGKLQALFDLENIKYTGCNYEGCTLSMNKLLAKKLVKESNLKTPNYIIYNGENLEDVTLPCVIKPLSLGSSIGISIVFEKDYLKEKINIAKKYDNKILIEQYIKGREFSQAFIGDKILPAIEIIPKEGFYDYENKYELGKTEEVCPANISDEQQKKLEDLTRQIIEVLNITKYGRVDYILGEDNNFYFLEANTLPGMTKTSLLPQEAKAAGMDYKQLLEKLIEL